MSYCVRCGAGRTRKDHAEFCLERTKQWWWRKKIEMERGESITAGTPNRSDLAKKVAPKRDPREDPRVYDTLEARNGVIVAVLARYWLLLEIQTNRKSEPEYCWLWKFRDWAKNTRIVLRAEDVAALDEVD